jgi:uncharacterized protein YndB with AHSA1/START domain
MQPLTSVIEIARPPQEVFAYMTDPSRFPEWQHDVVAVRMLDDSRFTTTRRISGTERTMTQKITRSDPPRSWAAQGIDGPIRPNATITIEPLDSGAHSRITITLEFKGHGVGVTLLPLVRRLAEKGAPFSYRNLKTRLEGQP